MSRRRKNSSGDPDDIGVVGVGAGAVEPLRGEQLKFALGPTRKRKIKRPGRPNRKGEGAHRVREDFVADHPAHVTVRLREGMPSLRRKDTHRVFARAVMRSRLLGVRVVHYSLVGNHFHLLVEADNRLELTRGMQSLNITLALGIKRLLRHKFRAGPAVAPTRAQDPRAISAKAQGKIGKEPAGRQTENAQEKRARLRVLAKRYHARILKSPAEVRRALGYVLFNLARHRAVAPFIDLYSSAIGFERAGEVFSGRSPPGALKVLVGNSLHVADKNLKRTLRQRWERSIGTLLTAPSSWLLMAGWSRG